MNLDRRNLLRNVGLTSVSVILILIVCEASLRVFDISYPLLHERDIHTGVFGLPGAEGLYTREGKGYVRNTSYGTRDRERQIAKPADSYRVVILGDSFMEAKEVDFEDAFPARLEARLRECPALSRRNAEVLNFGQGGFGTVQELQTFRYRARRFQPDMLLVAIYLGNDVSDNYPVLGKDSIGKPYGKLVDGRLTIDNSFRDDPGFRDKLNSRWHKFARRLINTSRLLQLVNEVRRLVTKGWPRDGGNRVGEQILRLSKMAYPPQTPAWGEAWEITEATLTTLAEEARESAASPIIVTIPEPAAVHPDAARRARPLDAAGRPVANYGDARLVDFAMRNGIPMVPLEPAFVRRATESGRHLYGFDKNLSTGHWNPDGHRLAAEVVAAEICRVLVAGQ